MTDKVYSVWYKREERWTDALYSKIGSYQKRDQPFRLTMLEATAWMRHLGAGFEVREVLSDNTSAPIPGATVEIEKVSASEPVFDFDKYNRGEKQ
jgi:hypothetical protein